MIEKDAERPLLNVIVRTVLWYVATAAGWYLVRRYAPADLGSLGGDELGGLVGGTGKASVMANGQESGPALLPTMIAMLSAFATALPVTWIYTYTRHKKG